MDAANDALRELLAIGSTLADDVRHCLSELAREDSPRIRRQLFRAAFAEIDSTTFLYEQFARRETQRNGEHDTGPTLAPSRAASDTLDESVVTAMRVTRDPFASNFLAAMNAMALALGGSVELPVAEPGWAALRESAAVRDRLMQPKTLGNLQVSDHELAALRSGQAWYHKCRLLVFSARPLFGEDV